jgi:protein-disulfide isomerase
MSLRGGLGLKRFVATFVLCVLVFSGLVLVCRADSEGDAQSAFAAAEQRVLVCYGSAADAAKAGANVTGLLSTLNDAGNLLSKADLAFENGDFNSSQTFVLQSQQKLEGFEAQADGLRQTATQARSVDFEVNVVGSLFAPVAVVLCALIIWFTFKKRHKQER